LLSPASETRARRSQPKPKQNYSVLIANFEPNEIARKSEKKTKFEFEDIAQMSQPATAGRRER